MSLFRPTPGHSLVLLAFGALFATACGDDTPTEPTTPSTITIVTGSTIPGRAAAQATVTVSVLNSNAKTLASAPVSFAVSTGGGSVVPPSSSTDANGQASAVWTFGNTIGAQTLTVTAGSVTQTITATVTAGLPATVAISAGAGQTAPAGTAVAIAPAVVVRDAANNPVSGVTVQFVSLPDGIVAPSQVITDASGVARVGVWTLGTVARTYTLQATVLDANIRTGNPVLITATATAGAANRIIATGSVPGTAAVGTALSGTSLPSVLVTDASGNPVAGTAVTFAVTTGGGTITGGTTTTNAQGIATVGGLTLGQTAGINSISATAAGIGLVTFAVTGTAGTAAQTLIVSGNNQAVAAGQALQAGPSVRVVDRFGNAVSGATVQFVVASGGGSVLGGTQTTNGQGIATVGGYTLGATPGANTLVARVAGAADVTFTATGLAGPATQLIKISGDSQTVASFRGTALPLVVRVLDAGGFPVRGTTVTFTTATTTGGTLNPANAVTDSLGYASTTFSGTGVLGQNIVTATLGSLPIVQFVVTTTSNVVASIVATSAITQSATVGGAVASPPTVLLRDDRGNPVPGVTVFFGVYTGSGSVQNATTVSDANGIATAGTWTISSTPGQNLLAAIASVPSNVPGSTITFTANGIVPPSNATFTVVTGITPSNPAAGQVVPVAVQVKDVNGNGIAGLTVQFQVTQGGGNIGGQAIASAVTDGAGIARINNWTLGSTAATFNSLTASLVGTGLIAPISVTTQ